MIKAISLANVVFGQLDDFEPGGILDPIEGATTVLEGAQAVNLFDVLHPKQSAGLQDLFGTLPASLDAAILAAIRSALERGLRTQVTWQPGYAFELRAWEVSEGAEGLLNLHIISETPPEPAEV